MENNANVNETAVVFKERLGKLMDWNGVSARELAEGCDVGVVTINKIFAELHLPRVATVSKIADFFMVSVDWLLGRVDELDEILSKEIFNASRILSYERYMKHDRDSYKITDGYLSPWPYNLAEEIVGRKNISGPLTDDQIAGFEFVLKNGLGEKSLDMVYMRYKDGKDMGEISRWYCVTKQCVWQTLNIAVKNLRHPRWQRFILNGLEGERLRIESESMQKRYSDLCDQLEVAIQVKEEELAKVTAEVKELQSKRDDFMSDMAIYELDLSVRAFNCLKREGCDTVGDILRLIEKNASNYDEISLRPDEILYEELLRFRNMGKRSALEVIDKLKERGFLKSAA